VDEGIVSSDSVASSILQHLESQDGCWPPQSCIYFTLVVRPCDIPAPLFGPVALFSHKNIQIVQRRLRRPPPLIQSASRPPEYQLHRPVSQQAVAETQAPTSWLDYSTTPVTGSIKKHSLLASRAWMLADHHSANAAAQWCCEKLSLK